MNSNTILLSQELPDPAPPDLLSFFQPQATRMPPNMSSTLEQSQAAKTASTGTSLLFPSSDGVPEKTKRTKSRRSDRAESDACKRQKRDHQRKTRRQASTCAEVVTDQPLVAVLQQQAQSLGPTQCPSATVVSTPSVSMLVSSSDSLACTMVDVLNAVRDAYDSMIAPTMEGSADTLESRLRVRMLRFMTLNFVKQQVEEKQLHTISCDDIARLMGDSLRRLNVNISIS